MAVREGAAAPTVAAAADVAAEDAAAAAARAGPASESVPDPHPGSLLPDDGLETLQHGALGPGTVADVGLSVLGDLVLLKPRGPQEILCPGMPAEIDLVQRRGKKIADLLGRGHGASVETAEADAAAVTE